MTTTNRERVRAAAYADGWNVREMGETLQRAGAQEAPLLRLTRGEHRADVYFDHRNRVDALVLDREQVVKQRKLAVLLAYLMQAP